MLKDDVFKAIDAAGAMSVGDREAVRELFHNKAFQRLLNDVQTFAAKEENLRGINLESPEGLAVAKRKQSMALGCRQIIEVIAELIADDEPQKGTTNA